FKEMKRDLRGTVLKVAKFLNIIAPDAVIDEVCRQSSFDYMKAIDKKFAMGKMIAWREPGVMIRAGKQGGSSEMLSLERQRQLDVEDARVDIDPDRVAVLDERERSADGRLRRHLRHHDPLEAQTRQLAVAHERDLVAQPGRVDREHDARGRAGHAGSALRSHA